MGAIDEVFERVFGGRSRPPQSALGRGGAVSLAHRILKARGLQSRGPIDPSPFDRARRDFRRQVASRTGQLLNLTEVARRSGLRLSLARREIAALLAARRILLLPAHPASTQGRKAPPPKLHVIDLGWLASELGWDCRRQVMARRGLGALVETAVVAEWAHLFITHREQPSFTYWASGPGREIDLVIERDGELHAVEVKSTDSPVNRHADGIRNWYGRHQRVIPAVIACRTETPIDLISGIRAVPWHLDW